MVRVNVRQNGVCQTRFLSRTHLQARHAVFPDIFEGGNAYVKCGEVQCKSENHLLSFKLDGADQKQGSANGEYPAISRLREYCCDDDP